ncbi:serine/threonine protein kinase [Streptomyces sp. CB02959]|uniref:serine/threonine-protein kinase n=1 Tax=Streptomyces sp. CB02959 TaxID=2020330 RepID=UPI000C280F56|nr:serine/threonine-protein kinase [Streptomyces sp. CB02959]PJN38464.1 serine/threonine protein kinase [Streptomyces sp. CB02959]
MTTEHPGASPSFAALTADDPAEIGGYRLHARLGSGGMGHVYLAYTPGGRPVALKTVRPELAGDPEFRHRFAQEVANARRIHGLYTAQVIDAGADAVTPWLATAYVPAPSLHEVLRRHGPLPVGTVLLLMAGIAEALQSIHGAGVVHRDLKPANVLVATDGPRVIDFGIARAADAVALTSAGLRIGTPAFMAPEQALGQPATSATDVFALGALAVYAAGGAPPFGDCPESVALYRAVHEQPDLGRVPTELHALLGQCLAKDPAERPTTGAVIEAVRRHPAVGPQVRFADGWLPTAVRTELSRHGDLPAPPAPPHAQPTVTATPVPLPRAEAPGPAAPPAPARRAGRPVRWIVATAVAALLLGGGAVYYFDYPPEDPAPPAEEGQSQDASGGGFRPGYAGVQLTSPDAGYEFDLRNGKVVPESSADWYLSRSATEFAVPDDSDAFIAPGGSLTPDDCLKGIDRSPVTSLKFSELEDQHPFCVRSANGRDVVIVRLVEAVPDGGAVTVSLSRYGKDS